MKVSNKALTAVLAAGLTFAGAAFAYGGGHYSHNACGFGYSGSMHALYQLDSLSDEQRSKIKTIIKEERKTMRDMGDRMQDNRDALYEAMRKNAPISEIKPLAKKQGEQIAEMIVARAELRNKINAVLTDAQRKELQQMKPQRPFDDDERPRGDFRGW